VLNLAGRVFIEKWELKIFINKGRSRVVKPPPLTSDKTKNNCFQSSIDVPDNPNGHHANKLKQIAFFLVQ
jgi:hypothetical protein